VFGVSWRSCREGRAGTVECIARAIAAEGGEVLIIHIPHDPSEGSDGAGPTDRDLRVNGPALLDDRPT